MKYFQNIQVKLEQFISKYYINELIKGSILFFSIGLLYFLLTLLIEHFLWLNPIGRTVLFWLFIAVELVLFIKFIAIPIFQLLKLKKGIDYKEASKIIGNHFSEVSDKLLNVIQLYEEQQQSELLLASIEQKSAELNPIPFKLAINLKQNLKYLKYAATPLAVLILAYATGKINWFSDSYQRVVNYKIAYQPPAPFEFLLLNENLQAIENTDFKILVKTIGDFAPESAQISFDNQTYYLQQKGIGEFEYVFEQPKENIQFRLTANKVISRPYTLSVLEVPSLVNFKMKLDYPSYTKRQDEVLNSTGNATVPQGTMVSWELKTKTTDAVFLYANDTASFESDEKDIFKLTRQLYKDFNYKISTSNNNLKDYEKLAFSIEVVGDEYPELNLKSQVDSLDHQTLYFFGQVSDDYGLSKLQLVYYPEGNENEKAIQELSISKSNFDEFAETFPGNLNLKEGVSYELYFEVFDNDAINRYKSKRSTLFTYRKLTKSEKEAQQLEEQNETIKNLDKSLEKLEEQERQLNELSKIQKEKSELNYSDKKKLENFLKRQVQQEQMMEKFNKRLQENLEDFQKEDESPDSYKEELQERLKENQEQLKKDEKLLEELQKIADKINKEEFTEKLEQLAKQSKNQKRSMEQLLELTKRYYVSKKIEKLANELQKLSEEQGKLSEEPFEKNTLEKQEDLNKKFEDFQNEMDSLGNDNKDLRNPLDIPRNKTEEKEIKMDQQQATDQLQEKNSSESQQNQRQNHNNAQQNQKKAAEKMKQMSQSMMSALQMGSQDQMQEDAEMLRQILDNLVLFSFDQEDLMDRFKSIGIDHSEYAKYLRNQHDLREHFQHIDDSLFALSLRQPKISEAINKEITEAYYNIDRSLNQFSESLIYQGVSAQQYTITSANNLADMLSNMLDNMQMSMSGQGQGQGQDEGLPDIIISQEELNKKMEEGLKKGEQGSPKEGESGKEGEGEKEGEDSGKQKDGKSKSGQNGKQTGEGEGSTEDLNGDLYEIYQRQQQLRQLLKDKLGKEGESGNGKKILDKMEEIELDLINKGFTNQTLQKMMQVQHQLLKLENAAFTQGMDSKRESETNKDGFQNPNINKLNNIKKYFNTSEILNRQTLPLQPIYKRKVQDYFKEGDDKL